MVKIEIKWDNIKPILKYASGILTIYDVKDITSKYEILLQCRATREQNSLSYQEIKENETYKTDIFEKYRDRMNMMVNAYYDGMTLKDASYYWVENT